MLCSGRLSREAAPLSARLQRLQAGMVQETALNTGALHALGLPPPAGPPGWSGSCRAPPPPAKQAGHLDGTPWEGLERMGGFAGHVPYP